MTEQQQKRIREHHDSKRVVLAGRITVRGGKVTAMVVKGAICRR